MSPWKLRTFGSRIFLLVSLTAVLAVGLVVATVVMVELSEVRRTARESADAQARIAALSAAPAVAAGDRAGIQRALLCLQPLSAAAGARVLSGGGVELGRYARDAAGQAALDTLPAEPLLLEPQTPSGMLTALATLNLPPVDAAASARSPRLQLVFDPGTLYAQLARRTGLYLGIGFFAWLVAMLCARGFARNLIGPVTELNQVARRVRDRGVCGERAKKFGHDELGDLTDNFNEMLDRVFASNEALEQHRRRLEARVKARTGELRDALAEAEAANIAKSSFLANMSHEIRTPMTAMLGHARMLLDGDLDRQETRQCVQTIHRNGKHLLGVVSDILDISKIEAGAMSVERLDTPLVELVADVASITRIQALEKGIGFGISFEGAVPDRIRTDPTRFRQVLINLIGNAIKFTGKGQVSVHVLFEPGPSSDGGRLVVEVRDTGIGMTDEQVQALFQPFSQADATTTRRFGGSGLGLAISRQLAQMLGGDVRVRSEPGRGSTFSIELDAELPEGVKMLEGVIEAAARIEPADGSGPGRLAEGVRVLLCEDGEDNRRFIGRYLQAAGARLTLAVNGDRGRRLAAAAERAGRPFDIVLMDMQMPVMDGYTATRKLRGAGYRGSIVALTAHAMEADRAKCLEAGCDDYLTKPVDHTRLLRTVAAQASVRSGAAPAAPAPAPSAPPAPPARGTAEAAAPGPAPAEPGLPPIHSRYASDPFLAELVEAFVAGMPAKIRELRDASRTGERETLARLLHQLKGAAGTHGFDALTQAAREAERALGEADPTAPPCGAWVEEICELCGRLSASPAAGGDGNGAIKGVAA